MLQECLNDGIQSVLIFEDDIEWKADAWTALDAFMTAVPEDWDQLMLGGQHQRGPESISKGVVRCRQTERTQAYAVRGKAIQSLYHLFCECTVHIDWDMGRKWQKDHNVYAPSPFLFAQMAGKSDINCRWHPAHYWSTPEDYSVIHLTAPQEVAAELRKYKWHMGFSRETKTDYDVGLVKIAKERNKRNSLKRWLSTIAEECYGMDGIPTVWHPSITASDVRQAHERVIEIRAETVEEALKAFEAAQSPS